MSRHFDNGEPRITEETGVRTTLKAIGWVIGATALVMGAWASLHYNQVQTDNLVSEHETRLNKHDDRLEKLEAGQADIAVIRNNVEWIREVLERREPTGRASPPSPPGQQH